MKPIASVLSIIALGFGLLSCSGGGGGGGGGTSAFAVSTTAADFGVVGNTGYSSTLSATGGTPPYTWTDVDNTLPSGLVFDTVTGIISGNPTASTPHAFTETFRVTDFGGRTASSPVTLRIRPRTDRVSVNTAGNSITGSSSTQPSINGTSGRFIAFSSTAPNLVAGVTGNQVYAHDRQTGQPSLVSRDNDSSSINPGNGASSAPSISDNGRFVAFVSQSTNLLSPAVPAVVAGQVYVRDTQTNLTSLVSQDNSGGLVSGNGPSSIPSISGDGRFVVFVSSSTNLVVGVAAGTHVYVRDTQTNLTSLVSQDNSGGLVPGNGASSAPSISDNGRFVAFVSQSTNLLSPAVPAVVAGQVYVRDTQTNLTSLVSQDNSGGLVPGNGPSSIPSISGDGRFVVFVSSSTNLVVGVAAGTHVYVRDTQTNLTSLVSQDNSGGLVPGNGASSAPSISDNGRFVAFVSQSTNLLSPAVPAVVAGQVYVRDTQTNLTSLVSQDNSGGLVPGNGPSSTPSITDNGEFVAFASSATNLGGGVTATSDIYVRALP